MQLYFDFVEAKSLKYCYKDSNVIFIIRWFEQDSANRHFGGTLNPLPKKLVD